MSPRFGAIHHVLGGLLGGLLLLAGCGWTSGPPAAAVKHFPEEPGLALATAVVEEDRDRLRELLATDADPNATGRRDVTMVQLAVMTGSEVGLRELLKAGADPERPGLAGEQPVFTAIFADNEAMLPILLEAGASPDARSTPLTGQGALSRAVSYPTRLHFDRLMAAGADVNLTDANGGTALHTAARVNAGALILELLDAGADPEARTTGGSFQDYYFNYPPREALNQRAEEERRSVVAWLLQHDIALAPGAEFWLP